MKDGILNITSASIMILDLDDTIYPTTSIPREVLDPVYDKLKSLLTDLMGQELFSKIKHDLWHMPIDIVCKKYNLPDNILDNFYDEIEQVDLNNTGIQVYQDYEFIKSLPHRKFLVTTGLEKFQYAKVKALNINDDFEEIHVDDPRAVPRIGKVGIISNIISKRHINPDSVWVIGDNPDSELKAGKELGCITVQRLNALKRKMADADIHMDSFHELGSRITT